MRSTVRDISANIKEMQESILAAANRSKRNFEEITVVAVSKKIAPESIEYALQLGLTTFGESKIQEAKEKVPLVSSRAKWHMVGHLQKNKARYAVELFDLIHSVDSIELAQSINQWAERAGKTQRVLLQVNVSGEKSKFGMPSDQVEHALETIYQLPNLNPQGLMTIAPLTEDREKARPYFRKLREIRDKLRTSRDWNLPELSMGMSQDFTVAIDEGATFVRIGSLIFGRRTDHDIKR